MPSGEPSLSPLLDLNDRLIALLDHHDRRERNALYPALERATTPEERSAILARP